VSPPSQRILSLGGREIAASDRARVDADETLFLEAKEDAEFILVRMETLSDDA
jgi:hypothetical protein